MAFFIMFSFIGKMCHFFTQVKGQTSCCSHTFVQIGGILDILVCEEGKC